jgi:hypothetical protein
MKVEPTRGNFANVRGQIGFCGIWCGGCIVGNGTLHELTRRYERLISTHGLPEWGPKEVDWVEFRLGLASIQGVAECPGCLKGGGRDNCEMKSCAQGRGLVACTSCWDFSKCAHADVLRHMREGALKAGIPVETTATERKLFIRKWSRRIRSSWPGCALFARILEPDQGI